MLASSVARLPPLNKADGQRVAQNRVDVKPWYYLTYWAVRGLFLSDPNSLTDFSTIIIQNVERRRTDKRWLQVLVDPSAAYDTMPGESEQIVVKSYRHTIRGANMSRSWTPSPA